jgi:hypothetical protein
MAMPIKKLTLAEYIEWENAQTDRNGFVRGEVFAMVAGAARTAGSYRISIADSAKQSRERLARCSASR